MNANSNKPEKQVGAAERFCREETGAVFLEFLIVLYAWMFILFGVIQIGLMAIGAFYVNYANFMALRTASVFQEYVEAGWMNDDDLRKRCESAAVKALAPMERYYWRNTENLVAGNTLFGKNKDAWDDAMSRTRFVWELSDQKLPSSSAYPGQSAPSVFIRGRLEYDMYLVIPFVNRVLAAFDPEGTDRDPPDNPRVMHNFASDDTPWGQWPTYRLKSSNSISNDSGDPPYFHEMVIQRRWRY